MQVTNKTVLSIAVMFSVVAIISSLHANGGILQETKSFADTLKNEGMKIAVSNLDPTFKESADYFARSFIDMASAEHFTLDGKKSFLLEDVAAVERLISQNQIVGLIPQVKSKLDKVKQLVQAGNLSKAVAIVQSVQNDLNSN